MKFSFPIKANDVEAVYRNNEQGNGGFYPVSINNKWHGGVHLYGYEGATKAFNGVVAASDFTHTELKDLTTPIHAIADGEVIAYRMTKKLQQDVILNKPISFSNCFVLIRHKFELPKTKKEILFYSLYMHLLPWGFYQDEGKQPDKCPLFLQDTHFKINSDKNGEGLKLFSEEELELKASKVIPKGAIVEKLEVPTTLPENHWRNRDGMEVFDYVRIEETEETGFAVLTDYSKELSGNRYKIEWVQQKTEKWSKPLSGTAGLSVHKSAVATSDVLRVIPKGEQIFLEKPGKFHELPKGFHQLSKEKYGEDAGYINADGNSIKTEIKDYIRLDEIVTPEFPRKVKGGDIVGYTGQFGLPDFFHLELFTPNLDFMNYTKDAEKPVECYRALADTEFLNKKPIAKEETCNIPKHAVLEIQGDEELQENDPCKVRYVWRALWVKNEEYLGWNATKKGYKVKKALDKAYVSVPVVGGPEPERVEVTNAVNSHVYAIKGGSVGKYRLVKLKLAANAQSEGWVRYDKATFGYSKRWKQLSLKKELSKWYDNNPELFKFEEMAFKLDQKVIVEKDAVQVIKKGEETWYGIKRPSYETPVGWIKEEENCGFEKLDYHNWKKFFLHLQEEKNFEDILDVKSIWEGLKVLLGEYKDDGYCDIKTVLETIESVEGNKADRILTAQEMHNALTNKKIAGWLRHLVVKHPTEWSVEAAENGGKWTRLLQRRFNWTQEKIDSQLKPHFEKLAWYDNVKDPCKLPNPMELYYFHPVAFAEHLKKLPGKQISLKDAQEIALKVTSVFEGSWNSAKKDFNYGMCAANFDLAGVSYGIIQWNIGTGTLWKLLKKMHTKNPVEFKKCYEHSGSETFKDFFPNKDIWKFDKFIEMINQKLKKEHYDWIKNLHKSNKIELISDSDKSGKYARISPAFRKEWISKGGRSNRLQSKLVNFFEKLGEVKEFQEIQKEEAIKKYGKFTKKKIDWLRTLNTSFTRNISLRSYVALFDLSVQQGGLGTTAMETIKSKLSQVNSQEELLKLVAKERGLTANSTYRNDCISRRVGILNAKKYKATEYSGTSSSERANSNLYLLKDNLTIEDF